MDNSLAIGNVWTTTDVPISYDLRVLKILIKHFPIFYSALET